MKKNHASLRCLTSPALVVVLGDLLDSGASFVITAVQPPHLHHSSPLLTAIVHFREINPGLSVRTIRPRARVASSLDHPRP